MAKKKRGINPTVGISFLVILLVLCIGAGFFVVSNAKSSFAKEEASMPESAISTYLKQIKANDFDGIYENSLTIDPHLNSKEDYVQAISSIYANVDADKVNFVQKPNDAQELQYDLVYNNQYISTVKLVQSVDGSYLASTIFQGDNDYTIQVPTGVTLEANGFPIDSSYMIESNIVASNFGGLRDTSGAPHVDVYELKNLISEPSITIDNGSYAMLKDALTNTYYVGQSTSDTNLIQTFIDAASACAKFPAQEGGLGTVSAYTITNSDFYARISTLQNDWFTTHNVAQLSNFNVSNVIQQSDDSMVGNVTFDYHFENTSEGLSRTYHIGYQITFLESNGSMKIAGFEINNELNPSTSNFSATD